jgi:hypothetical protein
MLRLRPITFREACAFIDAEHRHHKPARGWKLGMGAELAGRLVGVAVLGRPVARALQDGWTAEVTRLCTDGTPNACSLLYGACARAAKAMGYRRVITYTTPEEGGASLRASGWRKTGQTSGRSWTTPSRPREDHHPIGPKDIWERELARPSVFD